MKLSLQFSVLPALRAGETVLLFRKWVWLLSLNSFPGYRVFFSLPPLFEAGLYITNRRVLVLASAFRLITQEMSQWYAGKSDTADDEFITRFEVGRSSLLGPYLDVVSTCGKKRWYRSPELRLRLHMQDAEAAYRVIAEQNTPDQGCSS